MAMTKTTTLTEINITPETTWTNSEGEQIVQEAVIHSVYRTVVDDPDDNDLPLTHTFGNTLHRTTTTYDADGNATVSDTDLSGEDQLIQDIAAVVWA